MIFETCLIQGVATRASEVNNGGAGDREKLQGTWRVSLANRNGEDADYLTGLRLVFLNDRFLIQGEKGDVLFRGRYQVNASADPPHIDFVHQRDALHGTTWKGAYRITRNCLRICDNAHAAGGARPSERQALPGLGKLLIILRRL
jgi:uncharacterized protein (TIGR03067 family)